MQKKNKQNFMTAGILMLVFIIFTVLVAAVDVKPIGPENTGVGFAAVNNAVHNALGINMGWYYLTDLLAYVSIATAVFFAAVSAMQLIQTKSLGKVNKTILALGGFYVLVLAVYVLFEKVVINYRPVLENGELAASYPSSHTMLACCFLSAAVIEFRILLKNKQLYNVIRIIAAIMIAVMVVGRLLSGVHWFTDIIGGVLISAALVMLFYAVVCVLKTKK